MRTILFIIQKEFIQLKRNKTLLPIIFIVPIVQLIILVHAATLEMKNIDLFIVDKDLSSASRNIINHFQASPFFIISGTSFDIKDGESKLLSDEADIVLHIPHGFEQKLFKEKSSSIQLLINAINGTVAGIGNMYARKIINNVNQDILMDWYSLSKTEGISKQIDIRYQFWYNPELNYQIFMVPGILVLLVTIIGMFLSGMNLVREKEIGTIEQINVTPVKKYQFIIGKLFPFWLIALFELAFGLVIGKVLFDIPMVGSLWLIFLVASIYLFAVLGIGLFMSTVTQTQQQSMFVSWFFIMIFVLMSGLFTSTESMPVWAQKLNLINPVAYFIKVNRMILLKGSGFHDIIRELISISIIALVVLSLAVWRYRKTS